MNYPCNHLNQAIHMSTGFHPFFPTQRHYYSNSLLSLLYQHVFFSTSLLAYRYISIPFTLQKKKQIFLPFIVCFLSLTLLLCFLYNRKKKEKFYYAINALNTSLLTPDMCDFFPMHQSNSPAEKNWVSCKLTKFWHYLSGDGIRSHKLSVQSHKTVLHFRHQLQAVGPQILHNFWPSCLQTRGS